MPPGPAGGGSGSSVRLMGCCADFCSTVEYLNVRNASVVYRFPVCTLTFFRMPANVNGGVYADDTGVPLGLTDSI